MVGGFPRLDNNDFGGTALSGHPVGQLRQVVFGQLLEFALVEPWEPFDAVLREVGHQLLTGVIERDMANRQEKMLVLEEVTGADDDMVEAPRKYRFAFVRSIDGDPAA